jgi:hypothetical protein
MLDWQIGEDEWPESEWDESWNSVSVVTPDEPPSRSPRAANVAPNADKVWTLGVNWYVNRWVKVRFNAISETLDDPALGPAPGESSLRTLVMQFGIGF